MTTRRRNRGPTRWAGIVAQSREVAAAFTNLVEWHAGGPLRQIIGVMVLFGAIMIGLGTYLATSEGK